VSSDAVESGLDRYLRRLAQLPPDRGLGEALEELCGFLPGGARLGLVGFGQQIESLAFETTSRVRRPPPPLGDFLCRIISAGETVHVHAGSDSLYRSVPLAESLAGDELFVVPLFVGGEVVAALCYSAAEVSAEVRATMRSAAVAIGLRVGLQVPTGPEAESPPGRFKQTHALASEGRLSEALREAGDALRVRAELLPAGAALALVPTAPTRPELTDLGTFSRPPWRVVGSVAEADLAAPLTALLVAEQATPGRAEEDTGLLAMLSAGLGPASVRALMGVRAGQALALLARHDTPAARRLGEQVCARALSHGIRLKSFVSQAGVASDLYRMIEEVERLARLEAIVHLDNAVSDAHDFGVHSLLLELGSEERLSSWSLRLIGPLVSYDAEHRSNMVDTLEAYLETWGHLAKCAARLYVHPNTLKYRLHRIEDILSIDPRDSSARAELLIACYAYRAAQALNRGSEGEPPKPSEARSNDPPARRQLAR